MKKEYKDLHFCESFGIPGWRGTEKDKYKTKIIDGVLVGVKN